MTVDGGELAPIFLSLAHTGSPGASGGPYHRASQLSCLWAHSRGNGWKDGGGGGDGGPPALTEPLVEPKLLSRVTLSFIRNDECGYYPSLCMRKLSPETL